MSTGKAKGLKVLMLHGYTQSGPRFHDKTRALEKAIIKAFPSSTLHYPSGPMQLRPADITGYASTSTSDSAEDDTEYFAWWRRTEPGKVYQGMAEGLARVAETIRKEGPFDGAIGFSQGGAVTGILASLLEPGRREAFEAARTIDFQNAEYPQSFVQEDGRIIQDQLKFAIVYSGFAAPPEHYSAYYEPKITTPVLHFLGSLDTLVDEQRSRILVNACEGGEQKVVIHPGGHFVPNQKVWLDAAVKFIGECVNGSNQGKAAQEESVEDMGSTILMDRCPLEFKVLGSKSTPCHTPSCNTAGSPYQQKSLADIVLNLSYG